MSNEIRGQQMVGGAQIPPLSQLPPVPPMPEPEQPNAEQYYWDLMTRYNQIYGGLRAMLLQQNRVDPSAVLTEAELLDAVGAVFRDAANAPVAERASASVLEEDKAQREEWQRRENRWRALSTVSDHHPDWGVEEWISGAKALVWAVEADEFG